MRVAVLHNADAGLARGTPADGMAVRAATEMAAAVARACERNAWDVVTVAAPPDPAALASAITAAQADVVFNLVEALQGDARLESAVAGLLELIGIPFTGSGSIACALALDKPLARAVLQGTGVAVPAGCEMSRGDEPMEGLHPPFIVKPSREDASHGVSRDSIAASARAARERARWVIDTYGQPALVEEFVDGREFNVAILGAGETAEVLPLAEIDYSALPPGHPRLLTYEAKWDESSPVYRQTPPVPARDLDAAIRGRIESSALASYRALHLRDYGRVDLRLHAARGPLVLEVNANPDLSPGAGLAHAAARGGLPYDALIARIVRSALARADAPAPAATIGPRRTAPDPRRHGRVFRGRDRRGTGTG
ncbi:MAG: D-alanine--D-alanine ligase [Planctomycetota bacterium]|nr:MAG: D-alanine--D-alanine ligase [Planctomycetota bacterium]